MGRSTGLDTGIVGAGRLARALAPLLGPAGYPLRAVAARRLAAARSVCRVSPGARATTSPRVAAAHSRLILLAVPDRAIAATARLLSKAPRIEWEDRIVLHHAGALGTEPLAPLADVGASVGVFHPLQCLGVPDLVAKTLAGSRARIEGDRRGRAAASRLARSLGLVPLRLKPDLSASDRTAYHAAAALVSNDLVALLAIGLDLLESIGLTRRQATDALVPLIRGTLAQVQDRDIAGALTGPVPRGDRDTVFAHLERISRGLPVDHEVHRHLSIRLARLAEPHASPSTRRAIARLRRDLSGRRPPAGV